MRREYKDSEFVNDHSVAGKEMFESLRDAIHDAGGYISRTELIESDLVDLLLKLGVNGIRFTYIKKE